VSSQVTVPDAIEPLIAWRAWALAPRTTGVGFRRALRLGRLHKAIAQLNSQRITSSRPTAFVEYKGVMHVHSFLGGHSAGTFEEMIAAAQANHLNFVVLTEHTSKDYDTAAMTLQGTHAGVVFVNGNEISTAIGRIRMATRALRKWRRKAMQTSATTMLSSISFSSSVLTARLMSAQERS
jgi:hypothetical protein